MSRTLSRSFYIPKHYDTKIVPKGILAEIYLFDHGKPAAMGFGGKRSAPDFHYTFKTEARRTEYVNKYIDSLLLDKKTKDDRKAKANGFEHTLKVEDILYTSWGYDQTNIDFYQVTKVVGKKSVKIRKINGAVDHHDGYQSNYVVPRKNSFYEQRGEYDKDHLEMLKRVHEGNSITIESYAHATPWEGQPLRETDAYSGH